MRNSIPAVVIGADLNGLGVVRSLAHGSVQTVIVGTTRMRPAMWSRFSRAAVLEQLSGGSLIDGLLAIQDKLRCRPVLIMTDASAVRTVSENRDKLLGAYKFQLPPHAIVAMLQNKARFHEFAEQHDLPVPRTIVVKTDTSLAELSTVPFPVVVKSAESASNSDGANQVHFAATLKDAEILCRQLLESVGELVVQEWIDGPDSNICFSLFYLGHKPETFKVFAGRKLTSDLEKPSDASLCLAAPEVMDAIEPLIAKFLDLTEFQGLGSLEFKWDSRQRRYVIIGQTVGRTDWQEEIATLSGINLPLAAYRDEVGLPPIPSGEVIRTIAWQDSRLRRKRSPVLPPSIRVYDGYWRLNDPLPGLFFYTSVGLEWTSLHIVKPILRLAKRNNKRAALEKTYQSLAKATIHRSKASTR